MHDRPQPQPHFDDSYPDDVDRLFARLERALVPEELTDRVLSSTVARATPRVAWPWMLACLAAAAVLMLAGYQLGASLAAGDGIELVGAVFGDLVLLTTAPGDVLAALNEVVPWTLLTTAGLSAALLILAAGNIVSVSRASGSLRTRNVT
jgi:hypothetical protein